MQWLPDSIDALTRMCHEVGVSGALGLVFVIGMLSLLWRNLSSLLKILQDTVLWKQEDAHAKAELLKENQRQTAVMNEIRDRHDATVQAVDRISQVWWAKYDSATFKEKFGCKYDPLPAPPPAATEELHAHSRATDATHRPKPKPA
jgi:hypothetical protein